MSDFELQNTGKCRVWGWEPHRETPRYCGIYPRSSQAVKDACLSRGVLAFGSDTDVVIVLPKQLHDDGKAVARQQGEEETTD